MRAIVLCLLGYAMNFLTWGLSSTLDWDVLQFIAVSMIITYILFKVLNENLGLVAMIILGGICLVFSSQFPLIHYGKSYFYIIVFGDPYGGNYWPMTPWFAIFTAGILIGKVISTHHIRIYQIFIVVGSILLLVSMLSGKFFPVVDTDHIWGISLFKPSYLFPVGMIGFSFACIPLLQLAIGKWTRFERWLRNSRFLYFGRGILWVYLFSTVFGYHLATDVVKNIFRLDYRNSVIALPILIAINLICSYLICKFVCDRKKVNYKGAS